MTAASPSTNDAAPVVPPDLLAILACPACDERPGVSLDPADNCLVCPQCRRRYPVREGIVLMCLDDALPA